MITDAFLCLPREEEVERADASQIDDPVSTNRIARVFSIVRCILSLSAMTMLDANRTRSTSIRMSSPAMAG